MPLLREARLLAEPLPLDEYLPLKRNKAHEAEDLRDLRRSLLWMLDQRERTMRWAARYVAYLAVEERLLHEELLDARVRTAVRLQSTMHVNDQLDAVEFAALTDDEQDYILGEQERVQAARVRYLSYNRPLTEDERDYVRLCLDQPKKIYRYGGLPQSLIIDGVQVSLKNGINLLPLPFLNMVEQSAKDRVLMTEDLRRAWKNMVSQAKRRNETPRQPLAGKGFALTGKMWATRPEIISKIMAAGGQYDENVNGGSWSYLVVGKQQWPRRRTDKVASAQRQGTKMIADTDLMRVLDGEITLDEVVPFDEPPF